MNFDGRDYRDTTVFQMNLGTSARSRIPSASLASALGLLWHPGNFVDPSRLCQMIEKSALAHLEDTPIPLNIMATNQQGLGACQHSCL
jgi:hypothetical protein